MHCVTPAQDPHRAQSKFSLELLRNGRASGEDADGIRFSVLQSNRCFCKGTPISQNSLVAQCPNPSSSICLSPTPASRGRSLLSRDVVNASIPRSKVSGDRTRAAGSNDAFSACPSDSAGLAKTLVASPAVTMRVTIAVRPGYGASSSFRNAANSRNPCGLGAGCTSYAGCAKTISLSRDVVRASILRSRATSD